MTVETTLPPWVDFIKIVLMAIVHSYGGRATLKAEVIEEFRKKILEMGDDPVVLGWMPLPDGLELINLYGDKEIQAWEDGIRLMIEAERGASDEAGSETE